MKRKETKKENVIWHLRTYKSITSWQAIQNYGVTRLAAVIFNLKADGWDIYTTKESDGVTYWAKYILLKDKK
jgi:hypothetical protein